MDFMPLSDEELIEELRTIANEIREEAYEKGSLDLAFKAHVLFTAIHNLNNPPVAQAAG